MASLVQLIMEKKISKNNLSSLRQKKKNNTVEFQTGA